ncbi:hypothetical protein DSO57_1010218 [Entomophthora muscae]|uniref:Uncharacterized protein n=1 Tax=Entomophthora muscae TaxID=34485 RepID=A0ACC2S8C6_9FUNG|nr:hypothetical protein DSO57_1010218 [Entomophthora muscae]
MAASKRIQKSKDSSKSEPENKKAKKIVESEGEEISEKEDFDEEYKESNSDVPSHEPSDDEDQHGLVKNDAGEYFMDLPGKTTKRLTVRSFKGKSYVDFREFYEKDGKHLPGKKGISLSAEQWEAVKKSIEDVDKCIKLL